MNKEKCIYTKRLIDKLVRFNRRAMQQGRSLVDVKQVKKAICYAKKYHKGQLRHSGEPYYSHPIAVAYMVSDYLFRTDMLVTAILRRYRTYQGADNTRIWVESSKSGNEFNQDKRGW